MAAHRGDPHRRRGRPPGPDRRRAPRHPRGPVHRRRAAAAPRTARHRRPDQGAEPDPGGLADHQRARPVAHRARRWPPPASTGSTSAWTRSAATCSTQITRRDRLDDVLAGLEAAQARRARTGQGQRGAAARDQRPARARAAALVPRARLPAADHRADAAGRPAQLVARGHGHRRGDLRARSSRSSPSPPTPSTGGVRRPRPSSSTVAPPRSA